MKRKHRNQWKNLRLPSGLIGLRAGWRHACEFLSEAYVVLTAPMMRTHVYTVGSTGTGKTTLLSLLMGQDLRRRHSFVLLDLRGDLANAVLEILAGRIDPGQVALFDFHEKVRPLGFNPLAGAGEPYFRVFPLLDALASDADSWGVQLAETLRNALLLLSIHRQTVADLERLFYDAPYRRSLVKNTPKGLLRSFWERYGGLSPERQSLLAAPAMNKVSLLLSTESLRRTFGHQAPLDLQAHLEKAGSVTVASLAVAELGSAGAKSGSLLLSSISRELFSKTDLAESERNPVRLYLDEFENFGTRDVETILAEGRRFGYSCVLAHQTLRQLSTKVQAVVLGNVGTIVAFRTSRDDASVISRHVTGDPKALNLAELPVGFAYVCHQGSDPVLTEISAPLVTDVGRSSLRAEEFRRVLREATPAYRALPETAADSDELSFEASEPSLEEWL